MPFSSIQLKFIEATVTEVGMHQWIKHEPSLQRAAARSSSRRRQTLFKRHQSHCLATITIERMQVLLEGYRACNY